MKRDEIFKRIKLIMDKKVPRVYKEDNIEEVKRTLKNYSKICESIDYIYVIEKNEELIGVFSVKEVFRLPSKTKVKEFMNPSVVSISLGTNYKTLAHLALKHKIKSIPVIDSKKLIGVVPPSEVFQILNKTLRGEIFSFAGIHKSHLDYEDTMDIPIIESIIHRIPWLISGLIIISLAAAFIGIFENTLKENLILVSFIPVIVYVCGALCTQIETILVRDIAINKEFKLKKYMLKQGFISTIIAMIISTLLFLTISIFWKELEIASIISIAAFLSLTLTTLTSFGIVMTIRKFGADPALGGGPFGTVISDTLSIIIYLIVANVLL